MAAAGGGSRLATMVQRFDGTNYEDWKSDMEALLRIEGLWEHVNGEVEIPEKRDSSEYSRHLLKEEKAYGLICLLLDKTQRAHVAGTKTANAAWEALEDQFAKKGVQEAMFLRKRFLTLRMAEGTNIVTHITKMKEMVHEMKLLGVKTADIDFILVLLGSLPTSWDTVVTALEMNAEEALKLNFVLDKLRFEGAKRANKEAGGGGETTLTEGVAYLAARDGRQRRPTRRCYHCGDPGHIRRDCPELGDERRHGGGGSAAFAFGASPMTF